MPSPMKQTGKNKSSKEVNYRPIASELADEDEQFHNRISVMEGLNSSPYKTTESANAPPKESQMKLDQEQHYDLDGVTRIDDKVTIPSNFVEESPKSQKRSSKKRGQSKN